VSLKIWQHVGVRGIVEHSKVLISLNLCLALLLKHFCKRGIDF
jgi:hypothetical protein